MKKKRMSVTKRVLLLHIRCVVYVVVVVVKSIIVIIIIVIE